MITKFNNFLFESRVNAKMELPSDILKFKNEFDKYGRKIYVVGGAVRDFLTGKNPHDYDLVTDAQPDEIIEILKGFRTDEQGKSFGVIRVFTNDEPEGYEIATFRKDISKGRDTKGDDQKVEIGRDITIEDDVNRRDLTINALFYDIDKGEIIDLVGGLDDIKNNIIRAVGEPSKRFEEDRLRILRTIRFASRNLSEINKETEDAILKDNRLRNISEIDDVSQERIYDEIIKTIKWSEENNKLESLNFYFDKMEEYGLFDQIFPGLEISKTKIDNFNISTIFTKLFANNDYGTKFRKTLSDLKFPNDIINKVSFLLRLKNEIKDINNIPSLHKERKRIKISDEDILDFIPTSNLINAFLKFDPKRNGKDIIKLGFKGPEIGKEIIKREIEEFKKLLLTMTEGSFHTP